MVREASARVRVTELSATAACIECTRPLDSSAREKAVTDSRRRLCAIHGTALAVKRVTNDDLIRARGERDGAEAATLRPAPSACRRYPRCRPRRRDAPARAGRALRAR